MGESRAVEGQRFVELRGQRLCHPRSHGDEGDDHVDVKAQQRLLVLTHVLAGELAIADAAAYPRVGPAGRPAGRPAADRGSRGTRPRQPGARAGEPRRRGGAGIDRRARPDGVRRLQPRPLRREPGRDRSPTPSARTIRRILGAAGIASPRTRRPPVHRSRRERMPRAGMLLQADGSRHDWLEGRGPSLTLIAGIDDATGVVTGGTFRDHEDAAGYFGCSSRRSPGTVSRLPCTRTFTPSSSRIPTAARRSPSSSLASPPAPRSDALSRRPASAGSGPAARRPRAVRSACGARSRTASCPSSGARAWRPSRTPTRPGRHLPRHNRRFAVPAADPQPARRPGPTARHRRPVFCFEYTRRVERDATLGWDGGALSLPRRMGGTSWGRRRRPPRRPAATGLVSAAGRVELAWAAAVSSSTIAPSETIAAVPDALVDAPPRSARVRRPAGRCRVRPPGRARPRSRRARSRRRADQHDDGPRVVDDVAEPEVAMVRQQQVEPREQETPTYPRTSGSARRSMSGDETPEGGLLQGGPQDRDDDQEPSRRSSRAGGRSRASEARQPTPAPNPRESSTLPSPRRSRRAPPYARRGCGRLVSAASAEVPEAAVRPTRAGPLLSASPPSRANKGQTAEWSASWMLAGRTAMLAPRTAR